MPYDDNILYIYLLQYYMYISTHLSCVHGASPLRVGYCAPLPVPTIINTGGGFKVTGQWHTWFMYVLTSLCLELHFESATVPLYLYQQLLIQEGGLR